MPKVLTVHEIANFLKVHPVTIYRLLRGRSIPAFKVGGDWRFDQGSIERWMKEGEATASLHQS